MRSRFANGHWATPLTCAAGYAFLAARAIQLWFVMAAQQCVSLLTAGGHVPSASPLQCCAWIVGLLIRNSLRRLLLCGRGAIGARTVGSVLLGQLAPAFTAGLMRRRRGCGHVLLLIIELWQSLPWPMRPTLLATSGWLECKSAEQSAVCFEPVGMSLSPFSIRVPCTHSLCRMLTLRRGFYLRSIVRCVLNLLESVSSCIALLDSDLSSGRSLRSLFAHAHWAVRASPSTRADGHALLVARRVGLESCTAAECTFLCLGSASFGC